MTDAGDVTDAIRHLTLSRVTSGRIDSTRDTVIDTFCAKQYNLVRHIIQIKLLLLLLLLLLFVYTIH